MPKTDEPTEHRTLTQETAKALLAAFEQTSTNGSIILPKITTTTMRVRPERCRIRNAPVLCFIVAGRAVAERLKPPPNGIPQGANPDVFTALIADDEGWAACTFDDERMPDAIYRSGSLFLPYTAHLAVLRRMRLHGSALIALLFSAKPAANKLGYRWSYRNLITLDRANFANLRWADRLQRV